MKTITTLTAIKALVAYAWADEVADFVVTTDSDGPQPEHIFLMLQKLNATFELGYFVSRGVQRRLRQAKRARK